VSLEEESFYDAVHANRTRIAQAITERWSVDPSDPCDDLRAEVEELNASVRRHARSYTRAEVLELMELAYRRDLDREGSFEELLDEFGK
jgi:hypothetical protein